MELHATALQEYQQCPRKFYLARIRRLVPAQKDTRLQVGTAFHKAMAAYYTVSRDGDSLDAAETAAGNGMLSAIRDMEKEIVKASGGMDTEQQAEFTKNAELLGKMLQNYLPWAREHDPLDWERVLYVEEPFRVPILSGSGAGITGFDEKPAIHAGTFDLVVLDKLGRIWIVDHKTARAFPNPIVLGLNLQMSLYLLAAHYLFPDYALGGVLYSVTRSVDPFSKSTKTATILRFPGHRNDFNLRLVVERLANWVFEIGNKVEESDGLFNLGAVPVDFEPRPSLMNCARCPFAGACQAMENGEDYRLGLAERFTVAPEAGGEVVDDSEETA